MSFLGWPAEKELSCRLGHLWRRWLVLNLLQKFRRAFPEIAYDLLWESPTINAQAWGVGRKRHVTVYGGLVRFPVITRPGVALMIAHETGHHLGGEPRDPAMPWLTWQGQADYWAARTAMPLIFGSQARRMTLRGAQQILRLHEELQPSFGDDEPDLSAQCRYRIFCAGASNSKIPACAQAEYEKCCAELNSTASFQFLGD